MPQPLAARESPGDDVFEDQQLPLLRQAISDLRTLCATVELMPGKKGGKPTTEVSADIDTAIMWLRLGPAHWSSFDGF